MHTIEIPSRKITIRVPSCIDEMNPKDFIYMMQLLHRHKEGLLTLQDFKALLMIKLLRVKKSAKYYRMSEDQREMVHDHFNRILDLVDSYFIPDTQDGRNVLALNLHFIRNKVPRVGKYYGPADAMSNASFYEYKEAYNRFADYNSTNDENSLNEMIAILYRPRKKFLWLRKWLGNFDGQERIPFTSKSNPYILRRRISRVSKFPAHIKMAINLWFNSCMEYLRTGKPTIDGHEIDLSILYQGAENNASKSAIGLFGLLFSLSENKVFGDLFETANTNLYDIMARLYQLKVEYDNQNEKLRKK